MASEVLLSTVKLERKKGIFHCDTTKGQFSIYLPLPNINSSSEDILTFIKTSSDSNQITIWGQLPNDSDFIVFGRTVKKVTLSCKDGLWQCKND